MATMHAENLLSTRYVKGTVEEISSRYEGLLVLAQAPGAEVDSNVQVRSKLAEIELHLARANSLFQKRKFQGGLAEYKVTQGLVYGLMQPRFNPDLSLNPQVKFPVLDSVFGPLLDVSLNMVTQIAPNSVWSSFGVSSALPDSVAEPTKQFTNLGITTVNAVSEEVREAAFLGADAAERGQWAVAEQHFTRGLRGVGGGGNGEVLAAKASLQMNLAVVALQSGDADKASPLLKRAAAAFTEAGDLVGQAQATMNQAAVATKLGKNDESQRLLKVAKGLIAEAEGRAPLEPGARPSGAIGATATVAATAPLASVARLAPPQPVPRDGHFSAAPSVGYMTAQRPTIDPEALSGVAEAEGLAVSYRLPGAGDGWVVQDLESNIENKLTVEAKQLNVSTGDGIFTVEWETAKQIDLQIVQSGLYEKRIDATDLGFVSFRYDLDSDLAARLPHLYLFTLPVAMGDCHHALGEYNEALGQYTRAASYRYINRAIEVPALWIKVAQNYLAWGDSQYKENEVSRALETYSQIITPGDQAPASFLYGNALASYGDQVKELIATIADPTASPLNPLTISTVLDARTKLRMINAGLDFWGHSASHFPIFKFDYLQSIAAYFAQQAVQAEREYINFTARGEDEQLTREQLTQGVEISAAGVDLAQKQVEQAEAELEVTEENLELADTRLDNAQEHRDQYADVSYEMTALEAASVFASGPEGYSVSYTFYSPSEGGNVTLSGSDAYKVMEDAAWRRGMLSRELELDNIDRSIEELEQNKELAAAQQEAAGARVDVAEQQLAIADMQRRHAEDLLESFDSQVFTPEVWFQLGNHMKQIAASYLTQAVGVAKKMQAAYELETGFALTTIKSSYTTNIVSGLLSADYLLRDIDYFTIHRIDNTKSKDVPIKHELSLASLGPIAFETTFKTSGRLEFETNLAHFDRFNPGAYLRKIKKVEVVVEGLLPPGGVHGTLKNSGISRDRKRDGALFFRVQPKESLFLSQYNPRADLAIFQPDQRVLDVFEHCGVATGWTLEIPPSANDVNYQTITDVKLIVYYTAQHSEELEQQIKAGLPATGENSTAIPFRLLFPDEFFSFIDTGNLQFRLRDTDFAFNQTQLKVKSVSLLAATHPGTSQEGITVHLAHDGDQATAQTDANGMVASDPAVPANPLNAFLGSPVSSPWTIGVPDGDNPGLDRSQIRDLFMFLEYRFTYRS